MNFVLLKLMILQFFLFFFKYLKTNTNLDPLSLKLYEILFTFYPPMHSCQLPLVLHCS